MRRGKFLNQVNVVFCFSPDVLVCVHFKVVFLVIQFVLLRFKALSPQEAHYCLENMYNNVFFAEHSAWGPLRTYMEIEPCLGILCVWFGE